MQFMNRLTSHFIIIFAIASPAYSFAQTDTIVIRQSFNDLKDALLEPDGQGVLNLVDRNTFSFYSGILSKAKNYDSVGVESLQIIEKILVFTVRVRAEKDNIKAMGDSAFFRYMVNEGLIDKIGFSIAGTELAMVTVSGDSALGQLQLPPIALPYKVKFRLENNTWKTDLNSLMFVSNLAIKQMVFASKKSDTAFLLAFIKEDGQVSDERILWKPLNE